MFLMPSPSGKYSSGRRYRLYGLITIVIAAILLAIWFLWSNTGEEKAVHTTATVVRGNIENLVTATGVLQPRDYVDVGAQVSGQLKILHVDVGSQVKKGDLLADIDATVYRAKVDGSRAQLRNQRALLLDRQAQLGLAKVNYKRQQNLQKEDASTQESLESAAASLQSAQAQIEALQAQIEQTESSLRAEEANLEFARIYAPMDGTVVSITSRQGQTLNTNQVAPTLLRIADLSVMTVQAQVSEADIGKLKAGMQVYFTTLGSEGQRWYSRLGSIEPTPTVLNNVVLYNALFDVPNPDGFLMTQMTTQVFFVIAQARDVLLIPVSALNFASSSRPLSAIPEKLRDANAGKPADIKKDLAVSAKGKNVSVVNVINAKGIIEPREVTVGVTNRVQAEIISGLAEGEKVVTGIQQANAQQNQNRGALNAGPRMMR